jgi:hypothetical protein
MAELTVNGVADKAETANLKVYGKLNGDFDVAKP